MLTDLVQIARIGRQKRDENSRFRAYLKTLARYAWCDFLQAQQRPDSGSGDSTVCQALATVAAGDDLVRQLSEQFDLELLALARTQVQGRVDAQTWEAFRLTAEEDLSGAAAAQQLGMTVAAVFKAKSRVQQMLRDEVARLEGE